MRIPTRQQRSIAMMMLASCVTAIGCSRSHAHRNESSASDAGDRGEGDGQTGGSDAATSVSAHDAAPSSVSDAQADASQTRWMPPFDIENTTGWRDTMKPLCTGLKDAVRHSIWSHSTEGIYVMTRGQGATGANSPGPTRIHVNHNNGWELLREDAVQDWAGIVGAGDGSILRYGAQPKCGVQRIRGKEATCELEDGPIRHVAVVDPAHIYALGDDRVFAYDGHTWTTLAAPFESTTNSRPQALWANSSSLVVVGDRQLVYFHHFGDADFTLQKGAPAGDYQTVSGFGEGDQDIWAGTAGGQLMHYDGNWSVVDSGLTCATVPGVRALWASPEGDLYVLSGATLRKRSASGESRDLIHMDCDSAKLTAVWGDDSTSVFVTYTDYASGEKDPQSFEECGETFAAWYDGRAFRRL